MTLSHAAAEIMSRFPHNTGILSGHMALAVILWITVQISFTLLAPGLLQQTDRKQTEEALSAHYIIAGWRCFDTYFLHVDPWYGRLHHTGLHLSPCYAAEYRSVAIYVFLIPSGLFDAIIISELIVLYHFLVR